MMVYKALANNGNEASYSAIQKFLKCQKSHHSSGDQEDTVIVRDVDAALAIEHL